MKINKHIHLVIIRTSGSLININTYNCQELGLAKALYRKGINVSIILAGKKAEKTAIDGINIYYCKYKAINQQIAWFYNIDSILESLKPSIIQVHDMGLLMSWKVVKWAKRRNIPSFLIQGNYELTKKPLFRQFEYLFNNTFGRYILNHVTGIGYKTPRAMHYLQSYKRREMTHTYIGLDTSKFDNRERIDWSKQYNLCSQKVLLYIGAIEPRRNPLFLIDLIALLPDDYILLIAGSGPLEEETMHAIQDAKLEKKCRMLGKLRQEELPSLYMISDLFLLPSSYEIYGMVILEAMYFGLPVISSKTAGSEFIIEDFLTGRIIPDLDLNLWKSAILAHFENTEKANEMRQKAHKVIEEKYLWDKASESFMNLYFK